jgi:hypothetical protein
VKAGPRELKLNEDLVESMVYSDHLTTSPVREALFLISPLSALRLEPHRSVHVVMSLTGSCQPTREKKPISNGFTGPLVREACWHRQQSIDSLCFGTTG